MPAENGHADGAGQDKRSKMDIIESVLEVLESQQHDLDIAGFSMVSIYLNDAIERLRSERDGLVGEPKL